MDHLTETVQPVLNHPKSQPIGDWLLEIDNQELVRGDERRTLDPKDFAVLMHLAECAPDVVSTEDLLERNWPDVVVGDNVLHQVIGRLRKAFSDDAKQPRYIETRARRGYRLIAPLTEVVPATATGGSIASSNRKRLVIAALVIAALGLGAWFWLEQPSLEPVSIDTASGPPSIAVPPLKDLSPDQSLGWLAQGISEEISHQIGNTTGLEPLPSLLVRGDPKVVSSADYVVSGSLNRVEEEYVIRMEMVDNEERKVMWQTAFNATHEDPFELQLRAAAQITRYLGDSVRDTVYNWGPQQKSAREPFLRWMHLRDVADDWDEEQYWLKRTLEEAPDWGMGWELLGMNYLAAAANLQSDEYIEFGRVARDRALAAANGTIGYAIDALILGYIDGDLSAMEQRLRDAQDPVSHMFYVVLMGDSGLYREATNSFRLLSEWWRPSNPYVYYRLGLTRLYLGDYQGSLQATRQLQRLSPAESFRFLWAMCALLPAMDRFDEAQALAASIEAKLGRQTLTKVTWALNKTLLESLKFYIAYRCGNAEGMAAAIEGSLESPFHAAGSFLPMLIADDPRAPEYVELAKAHPEWVRMSWHGIEPNIEPRLRDHPLVLDLKQSLGFTPEWRLELCKRASTMPKETGITCNPEDYALPESAPKTP